MATSCLWHGPPVSAENQTTQTRTPETRTQGSTDTGFFGQPRVLANLFGVEMWERFSFYGMQGIVLLYLYYRASQGGLGMDQGTASAVIGAYGGLVYLATIPGAWLADRVLGLGADAVLQRLPDHARPHRAERTARVRRRDRRPAHGRHRAPAG